MGTCTRRWAGSARGRAGGTSSGTPGQQEKRHNLTAVFGLPSGADTVLRFRAMGLQLPSEKHTPLQQET
uniref:Uncharacterized protein n=1 Tax=Anguilla anguilla TaxID=7936 RepID=A0A0E9WGG0_ANGAN